MDLAKAHFSCRKWDITGIPCADAITCIFFNRQDAKQYVHKCFHVSTYKAYYKLRGPVMSNLFSFLSKKDHLAGPRRRE